MIPEMQHSFLVSPLQLTKGSKERNVRKTKRWDLVNQQNQAAFFRDQPSQA
jgi:hypothetical protein